MIRQLEGSGLTMLSPYRGLVTSVEFQCVKGHVIRESPGLISRRKSCPRCVPYCTWQNLAFAAGAQTGAQADRLLGQCSAFPLASVRTVWYQAHHTVRRSRRSSR